MVAFGDQSLHGKKKYPPAGGYFKKVPPSTPPLPLQSKKVPPQKKIFHMENKSTPPKMGGGTFIFHMKPKIV